MRLHTGFFRFIWFEIDQHIIQKRWLLLFPIMLFISYLEIGGVLIQSSNRSLTVNAWDALFSVFGNGNILFFVVTTLYLYLVSDLASETGFSEAVLFRLGSRRLWWLGKTLTLIFAVVAFVFISVGIVSAVASFVLPWQNAWSEAASRLPLEFFIVPPVLAMKPATAFGQLLFLLGAGWLCLGLLTLVITQIARYPLWGFIAAISTNLISLIALRNDVRPPYSFIFIHQHLLFNYHSFGSLETPYPPMIASVLYWVILIALFFVVGWWLSLRRDFIRMGHEQ